MIKVNNKMISHLTRNGTYLDEVFVNNILVFERIRCEITAEPERRGKINFTFKNKGNTRLNIYITKDTRELPDAEIMAKQTITVNPNSSKDFFVRDSATPEDYLFYINNGMNYVIEKITEEEENSSESDPYYS
ncbi:hypothetical protein [Metamycoplasma gateae]|uniref:Uncharacterized protein n=1 Tax=Metamycoplasma gateae TaxID=35769 RepID=A0ABZ2AHF9_9BACT|nr:hypothetical protein V2E26_02600 [Metamycoplasma gateae]